MLAAAHSKAMLRSGRKRAGSPIYVPPDPPYGGRIKDGNGPATRPTHPNRHEGVKRNEPAAQLPTGARVLARSPPRREEAPPRRVGSTPERRPDRNVQNPSDAPPVAATPTPAACLTKPLNVKTPPTPQRKCKMPWTNMTEFLLLPPFDDPTMRPAARELAASDVNPRTTATQMTTIAEPSSGAETRRGWTRWGSSHRLPERAGT